MSRRQVVLAAAVRESPAPPWLVSMLLRRVAAGDNGADRSPATLERLTPREREVLRLVVATSSTVVEDIRRCKRWVAPSVTLPILRGVPVVLDLGPAGVWGNGGNAASYVIGKVRRRELWNDRAEPRNRHDVPRRIVVETLILAGPRISEFCGLSAHHLDLAVGRLRIPRDVTKTDAGERSVPLVPALREHLTDHRLDFPAAGAQPAFPTRNGTRPPPDNVRARILAPLRERANDLLEAEGRVPIAHMTPAHAAAHLRLDPRLPHGPHRSDAHAGRLPAGARHGQGIDRAPRGDPRLQPRRGPRDYNGETVAAEVSVLNPCSSKKNPSVPSGRSAAEG